MKVSHSLQIATKGLLGVTVGTVSKGFIIHIAGVHASSGSSRTGPRRRSYDKKDKKCILVTVIAYGKTYKSEHCVNRNARVRIEDVHIVDDGEKIISVEIRNVR